MKTNNKAELSFGKVTLKIDGRFKERFINSAIKQGASFISVIRKDTSFYVTTNVSHFYTVASVAREMGLSLRIVKKSGFSFWLHRLVSRPGLLFGIVIALILMLLISQRTFIIRVSGCNAINPTYVYNEIEKHGICTGKILTSESLKELPKLLVQGNEQIAWAGVRKCGILLYVDIQEATTKSEKKLQAYGNAIIANKDGIITEIIPYKGKPLVAKGSVVKKGDILISGDSGTEEKPYIGTVCGRIMANVVYRFEVTKGPYIKKLTRTGATSQYVSIRLFNMDFSRQEFDKEEREKKTETTLSGIIPPITIDEGISFELKNQKVKGSVKELSDIAYREANEKLLSGIDKSSIIVSKSTEVSVSETGAVCVVITVVTEEEIGVFF